MGNLRLKMLLNLTVASLLLFGAECQETEGISFGSSTDQRKVAYKAKRLYHFDFVQYAAGKDGERYFQDQSTPGYLEDKTLAKYLLYKDALNKIRDKKNTHCMPNYALRENIIASLEDLRAMPASSAREKRQKARARIFEHEKDIAEAWDINRGCKKKHLSLKRALDKQKYILNEACLSDFARALHQKHQKGHGHMRSRFETLRSARNLSLLSPSEQNLLIEKLDSEDCSKALKSQ